MEAALRAQQVLRAWASVPADRWQAELEAASTPDRSAAVVSALETEHEAVLHSVVQQLRTLSFERLPLSSSDARWFLLRHLGSRHRP